VIVATAREAYEKAERYEHISGPGCLHPSAYHGDITLEEMRGCHTVQCISLKPDSWEAQSDDLDFEREGDCHLTGISPFMPLCGWLMKFYPPRHGISIGNATPMVKPLINIQYQCLLPFPADSRLK